VAPGESRRAKPSRPSLLNSPSATAEVKLRPVWAGACYFPS
jgi:hypothetical protein